MATLLGALAIVGAMAGLRYGLGTSGTAHDRAAILLVLAEVDGAVFAFSLGVTLVALQLSSRYSSRYAGTAFRAGGFLYIVVFLVLGIISPAIVSLSAQTVWAEASAALAMAILVTVPWFILEVVRRAQPESVVRRALATARRRRPSHRRLSRIGQAHDVFREILGNTTSGETVRVSARSAQWELVDLALNLQSEVPSEELSCVMRGLVATAVAPLEELRERTEVEDVATHLTRLSRGLAEVAGAASVLHVTLKGAARNPALRTDAPRATMIIDLFADVTSERCRYLSATLAGRARRPIDFGGPETEPAKVTVPEPLLWPQDVRSAFPNTVEEIGRLTTDAVDLASELIRGMPATPDFVAVHQAAVLCAIRGCVHLVATAPTSLYTALRFLTSQFSDEMAAEAMNGFADPKDTVAHRQRCQHLIKAGGELLRAAVETESLDLASSAQPTVEALLDMFEQVVARLPESESQGFELARVLRAAFTNRADFSRERQTALMMIAVAQRCAQLTARILFTVNVSGVNDLDDKIDPADWAPHRWYSEVAAKFLRELDRELRMLAEQPVDQSSEIEVLHRRFMRSRADKIFDDGWLMAMRRPDVMLGVLFERWRAVSSSDEQLRSSDQNLVEMENHARKAGMSFDGELARERAAEIFGRRIEWPLLGLAAAVDSMRRVTTHPVTLQWLDAMTRWLDDRAAVSLPMSSVEPAGAARDAGRIRALLTRETGGLKGRSSLRKIPRDVPDEEWGRAFGWTPPDNMLARLPLSDAGARRVCAYYIVAQRQEPTHILVKEGDGTCRALKDTAGGLAFYNDFDAAHAICRDVLGPLNRCAGCLGSSRGMDASPTICATCDGTGLIGDGIRLRLVRTLEEHLHVDVQRASQDGFNGCIWRSVLVERRLAAALDF